MVARAPTFDAIGFRARAVGVHDVLELHARQASELVGVAAAEVADADHGGAQRFHARL